LDNNFIEQQRWRRAAKVLAAYLYNTYERDWMELAQCPVSDPEDKSFIDKPSPELEEKWAMACASCPVFNECHNWADREDITGTYIAGEWRDG